MIDHLVEANRVAHEAHVHAGDGEVGDNRKPEELPQWNMLRRIRDPGGIRHAAHEGSDGEVAPGQSCG